MVKSRFCPSPTGLIHFGSARTALFNFLLAKNKKGIFLLRIEDSDMTRSKKIFERNLQDDLLWMGLEWKEGPNKDGGSSPYYQSERQGIYNDYCQRLKETGFVYPCFCSEEQLTLSRKKQKSSGKPQRYIGTCRTLSEKEIEKKLSAKLRPAIRFRVPDNEMIVFTDFVRGEQKYKTNDIGDFVIRRASSVASFIFCNAIDDALMKVTHVLRGEDHLTNTPKQLLILRALKLPVPFYGHTSLIIESDGNPLSKRYGSRSIKELRRIGYLPEAIVNCLARLGHYYESNKLLSLIELAKEFNIAFLSKSPSKFNIQQLNYWQKKAVAQLPQDHFWKWVKEDVALKSKIPSDKLNIFLETVKPNIIFPRDVSYWIDVCFNDSLSLISALRALQEETRKNYFKTALKGFRKFNRDLESIIDYIKNHLSLDEKGGICSPLRLALTGVAHGPELSKLIALMDDRIIWKRLQEACR
ncbi:glutamate--tRNA ligase [Coxiella endosymbiont of Amblyomma americanum]|uniref:glutamate--tRNA ligase n=1 Tax=Coxiella endosymbiont of Amblyomma americanum TaxID=325775 RepID=UPI00057F38C6|nr:glutamate--tRNA ligase [Coxiella endosymbiont of Amblyomma americanum]AJC50256.1 glutamyl-tRNA synthetase [Coxiella endosymbiont of Amblyomma americanum]AUJ58614.1 glutamate--tRNA ligase [Coxiella-like endosymbiont of Amblyomma americanum]